MFYRIMCLTKEAVLWSFWLITAAACTFIHIEDSEEVTVVTSDIVVTPETEFEDVELPGNPVRNIILETIKNNNNNDDKIDNNKEEDK